MLISQSYQEQEILARVAKGDEQAFATLVQQYHGNIFTAALRLLHRRELAEEVLQDIFLKTWLKRTQLPELDSFAAWLTRVARNTIYTAFRYSLKEPVVVTDETVLDTMASFWEEEQSDKEYHQLLQQAIAKLPPRQQQTWRLIREEGKKRNEAAAELGISPETVKFHLEEASRKVRTYCLSRLPVAIALILTGLK